MANLRDLNELAARQHALITRVDLERFGWSTKAIRRLVRSGSLVPLGRHTFAIAGVPTGPRRNIMAACLDTGGVACRGTAAWLHGIEGFGPGEPPSVVTPRARRDYGPRVAEVHTSSWLPSDDVVRIDGIPCLSVARTLFSLAAAVPAIDLAAVAAAVDVAIRDGKATDPWLWWLLERTRCRGRNGVTVFEGILSERAGGAVTESWLEREFLRLLDAAGIPRPRCQQRIASQGAFVARVDFVYEDLGVVIEVSGYASHSTRQQQAADARRRNALQAAGFDVMEFTYDDVVSDPAYVVARVVELLVARRRVAA